jgi:S-adenosylmethionine:tRNA ribosyltransferase-isomerase
MAHGVATEPVIFTPKDWELSSYDYHLPPELIAARPVEGRVGSRLLVHDIPGEATTHTHFHQLREHLPARCTLVLNRSRVFPCRLLGNKTSGGECEAFVLSLLPQGDCYQVLLRAGGKRKVGEEFFFGELKLQLAELGDEGTFWVRPNLAPAAFLSFLEVHAGIPIPPYIRNGVADEQDRRDYQTVYAEESGSVAAPTAGLHFTPELLEQLKAAGHRIAYVTLHVGLGTFRPVKSDDIREHHMHGENYTVDTASAALIREGNLVAVGTTSLRVLESCWRESGFEFPANGEYRETRIFIHPGKPVRSIVGLITNFHLPQSSLLMLVSALAGREKTLALYAEAIAKKYRFFSYGDAMLLKR